MRKLIILTNACLGLLAPALLASDTQENWDIMCRKCHGQTGKGDTKMGEKTGCKNYTDPVVQAKLTDAEMARAIKDGVKDGDQVKMKAYDSLSADEIQALVKLIRGFKK